MQASMETTIDFNLQPTVALRLLQLIRFFSPTSSKGVTIWHVSVSAFFSISWAKWKCLCVMCVAVDTHNDEDPEQMNLNLKENFWERDYRRTSERETIEHTLPSRTREERQILHLMRPRSCYSTPHSRFPHLHDIYPS